MFIKLHKKRKAASFLRVSVGGKPLELTQGHGKNVLPERWNLRLSIEKRIRSVKHWSEKEKLHNVRVRYDIRKGVNRNARATNTRKKTVGVKPEEGTMILPQ